MKLPYDFWPEPTGDTPRVPNLPSELGAALGEQIARFAAPCIEEMRRECGALPPCHDCAFVKGTIPNQSLATVATAMKCVVEHVPFFCHHARHDMPEGMCVGFTAMSTTFPVSEKAREFLAAVNEAAAAMNQEPTP